MAGVGNIISCILTGESSCRCQAIHAGLEFCFGNDAAEMRPHAYECNAAYRAVRQAEGDAKLTTDKHRHVDDLDLAFPLTARELLPVLVASPTRAIGGTMI